MRRAGGTLLLFGGAVCLYFFVLRGAGTEGPGIEPLWNLPLRALGAAWPRDTLLLLGAGWGIVGGWVLLLTAVGAPLAEYEFGTGRSASRHPRRGAVSRLLLVHALLLLSTLGVVFVGARSGQPDGAVGLFFGVAALQIVLGLLLVVISVTERRKSVPALAAGILLWLAGSAAGVAAFVQGG